MKKEIEQEKEKSESKEKNEVSLVKINSELYKEIFDIIQSNQIDYPSIKNFVEVAVRNQINLIKYDIENRDALITHEGKFKSRTKSEFTSCLACGNLYMNEKDKSKKGKRLCPKCNKIIKNLSRLVD